MKNNKGQALVEFIIVLPILLLLIMAIIDLGNIFIKKYSIENDLDVVYDMYKVKDNNGINNYVKEKGVHYADMASARAGHSEHQTGLAVDIADLSLDYDNFESTKEFNWIKKNAHKYGFILRYPKAKFHITGFKYEPWHYRYVGVNIATYIYQNNLTLEEYKKITHTCN